MYSSVDIVTPLQSLCASYPEPARRIKISGSATDRTIMLTTGQEAHTTRSMLITPRSRPNQGNHPPQASTPEKTRRIPPVISQVPNDPGI